MACSVSVFISANANKETLLAFFLGTYDKILARAKAIVAGEPLSATA